LRGDQSVTESNNSPSVHEKLAIDVHVILKDVLLAALQGQVNTDTRQRCQLFFGLKLEGNSMCV
jgi:hypothetical protein